MPSRTKEAPLTILFRLNHPEQAEALHALRATFQGSSDVEAVTSDVFALHLWPGCWCASLEDEDEEAT
jgi:hypothetical protein